MLQSRVFDVCREWDWKYLRILYCSGAALNVGKEVQREMVGLYCDVLSDFSLPKSWRLRIHMSFSRIYFLVVRISWVISSWIGLWIS